MFWIPSTLSGLLVLIFLILMLGPVRPNLDAPPHVVSFPTRTLDWSRSEIFGFRPSEDNWINLSIYASTWHESDRYGLPLLCSTRPCVHFFHMCSSGTYTFISLLAFSSFETHFLVPHAWLYPLVQFPSNLVESRSSYELFGPRFHLLLFWFPMPGLVFCLRCGAHACVL